MQTDLFKYLIKNEGGKKIVYLHKMGTSHNETFERFIVNEGTYIFETKEHDSKLVLRFIINPKKNRDPRDAVTYMQYVRVLVFYGLIDYTEIIKFENFNEIESKMESGEELSFEVKNFSKEQFLNMKLFIANNIKAQLNSKHLIVKENAESFISSLFFIKILKDNDKEINEKNIKEICDGKFELRGLKQTSSKEKLETFVKEIARFKITKFLSDENFYLDIVNLLSEG